jgi:hypothetical protein
MIIPGLKVLDEIIAGLPTNSAQRLELEKLRLKSANDDARIKALEAQIKALIPQSGIDVEAAQVLQQFAAQGRELNAHQIADSTGIALGKVIHHLGSLRVFGFVQQSRGKMDDSEPPHRITTEGSSFLVEHGML